MTFGLIGKKLSHSFSRQFFEKKFALLGLDHQYLNFELADINGFPDLFAQHPTLVGINVTIPYKSAILSHLDTLSPQVRDIGAANTVSYLNGKPHGDNTDVIGFELSLKQLVKSANKGRAFILGSGGASKAVEWVLAKADWECRKVSRNPNPDQLDYAAFNFTAREGDLIVNCTPLGTFPQIAQMPDVETSTLERVSYVIDLIYNPSQSLLLQKAKAAGCHTLNGLPMLIGQAEASWKIWQNTLTQKA